MIVAMDRATGMGLSRGLKWMSPPACTDEIIAQVCSPRQYAQMKRVGARRTGSAWRHREMNGGVRMNCGMSPGSEERRVT